MRPNRLTLTAFGPYHETEVIDFDALSPHDLFVVSGNTGAGKTSIFDGISYALFGGASGEDRREATSLRSDFADDDLPSSVELIFTIAGKQFRVMRQLAYQKAGNKSETPGKAELYQIINHAGEVSEIPAVDRQMISDVNQKMQSLIGLTKEQFNQLVMLPQGEYQRFLTSSTSDKEAILRTVFNTEKYRALVDELKIARDASQKEVTSLSGNLDSTLASIFRTLPKRDSILFSYQAESGEISINPHQAREALVIETQHYNGEKTRFKDALKIANEQHQKAQTALISHQALNAQFTQLTDVTNQFSTLLAKMPAIENIEIEIQLAEKAQPIEKYSDTVERLRTEARTKHQQLKMIEETYQASQTAHLHAKKILDATTAQEAEREALHKTIIQLEANEPKVNQLTEKRTLVLQLEKALKTQEAELLKVTENSAELPVKKEALTTQITELEQISAQTYPLLKLKSELESIDKHHRELHKTKTRLSTLQTEHEQAIEVLTLAKSTYESAYEVWLKGQANKLAEAIKPGDACPVCGSFDHPKLGLPADINHASTSGRKVTKPSKSAQQKSKDSPQASLFFEEESLFDFIDVKDSLEALAHSKPATEIELIPTLSNEAFAEIEARFNQAQSKVVECEANCARLSREIDSLRSDEQAQSTTLNALLEAQNHNQIPEIQTLKLALLPIDATQTEITALLETISLALKQAEDANKHLTDARKNLQQIDQALEASQKLIHELQSNKVSAEANQKIETEGLKALMEAIPAELQDSQKFHQALTTKRATLVQLKNAHQNAEIAYQKAEKDQILRESEFKHLQSTYDDLVNQGKEARKVLDKALISAGFIQSAEDAQETASSISDEAGFKQALRTPEALNALRQTVNRYREQKEALKQQKAQLEKTLKDQSPADIPALELASQEAQQEVEAIQKASFEVESLLSSIAKIQDSLTNIGETFAIANTKLSRLTEVYNLVRGENTQKLSFERYILIEYFERVIEAANLRLQKMTNGQFEFVRSDELASRGRQSGLDLNIYDAYTGEARDVKSLSGGEKFKASLSLSLGMADVIQAHQGGISIGTLFIDEGFGSLDEESLLQAIDVLIDLQKSGRMIGVISHVEELKQTLPARIEVTKTQGGFSKTRIITQ